MPTSGTSPSQLPARRTIGAVRPITQAVRGAILLLASIALIQTTSTVHAADAKQQQERKTYQIPAGSLEAALLTFAGQAGVNLSLAGTPIRHLMTQGLSGQYSVQDGFARLLQGSGMQAVQLKEGNYTIAALPTSGATEVDGQKVSAAVAAVETELPAITVTDRLQSNVISPTRQVTTIQRQELDTLRQGSNNLSTLLSKAVPGMADSSRTITDSGQTLRGREMLVLVDGIPLNTNRGSSRNLANINPADIEQIEILRGSSAIYGSGAAGGIVSVRTRRPEGEVRAETTVTATAPLSRLNAAGLGADIQHYISGAGKVVDYTVSLGASHVGGSYDAKGKRIAPEPSQGDLFDSNIYSLSTKIGFKIDADQRLQFSASHYDAKQDTNYAADPRVAALPAGSVPANAIKGLQLDRQNRVKNTLLGLDYEHRNLGGSTLAAQVYYRDFFTRFSPFDARAVPVRGANVDQAMQNSDVYGGRLTIKSPLDKAKNTLLVWGADYHHERTDMPLDIFNPTAYDASGGLVFQKTGRLVYMPAISTSTAGVFAQLQHRFNQQWSAEGGIRYDKASGSFKDFVPLSQLRAATPGTVKGGTVDYSAWTYNAGLVFAPVKQHEFYASYSQGFQLPDIGLVVRNAPLTFNAANSNLQAIKTDTIELGWRGRGSNTLASLSVFESKSDLGGVQSFNNGITLTRTKEHIQGVEGSIDYFTDNDRWSTGASFTWIKGRELPQNALLYQDMNGSRIPPLKLTSYIEYRPDAKWNHRLQVVSYQGKDYRLNGVNSFSRRDTSGYTTVDLISRWKMDSKNSLAIGVENLFNRYYYPLYSQLLRSDSNTSHLPAAGTVLKVSYTHAW